MTDYLKQELRSYLEQQGVTVSPDQFNAMLTSLENSIHYEIDQYLPVSVQEHL